MNDSFARLVDPFFQEVIRLQEGFSDPTSAHPSVSEVHDRLVALIQESRQAAAVYHRPRDYTELAEYALVYWADEVLIGSGWVHAKDWLTEGLLEDRLYTTMVGGNDFFKKAERAHTRSRDALETFFVCVMLGFRGCYRGHDLKPWVEETYQAIYHSAPSLAHDSPADGPGALLGRTLLLRASVLAMITVLATLAALIATAHLD
jgi:type VI secretion system protein ImpK